MLTNDRAEHTWVFLMQKVTEVKKISLNYDEEGYSQQHKDDHIHWKTQVQMSKKNLLFNQIIIPNLTLFMRKTDNRISCNKDKKRLEILQKPALLTVWEIYTHSTLVWSYSGAGSHIYSIFTVNCIEHLQDNARLCAQITNVCLPSHKLVCLIVLPPVHTCIILEKCDTS